jgi:peptidoglycan hydrolase CwlO-like protein
MMKGKLALLPALLAGIMLFGTVAGAEETGRSIEQLQQLLQESLTIAEIDREVERLSQEQERIAAELDETEIRIERQAELEAKLRQRAGNVLRAYYMRDRQSLWLLLLHADSFGNALTVFQYLQTIAENDRLTMDRYVAAREQLSALRSELQERLQQLDEAKAEWLRQRERVIALQAELDRKLAEAADREAIIAQMEALNRFWQEQGLPYFQSFLEAMSGVLAELPDYVNVYPDSLTQQRTRITFTVRERELNAFLREKNPLFQEFAIGLAEAGLTIEGNRGELSIGIDGRFELTETADGPAIRFMLTDLRFGPFSLPDTTVADMQRRFSMTFSTKQHELTAFLLLDSVEHRDGELALNMKIDL